MLPPVISLLYLSSIASAFFADKSLGPSVEARVSRASNWTVPRTPLIKPRALPGTLAISNQFQCEGDLCEQTFVSTTVDQAAVTPRTTVRTITSCLGNVCSDFTTTSDFQLVNSDDITIASPQRLSSLPSGSGSFKPQNADISHSTSMDVPEPVTFDAPNVLAARKAPHTTVITITSCSEEKCSEVKTTTGYTVVTSEDTIYTTYCPLTVSHASSSVSILLSVTSISQRSSSSSLSSSSRGPSSTPSSVPTVVIPSVTTSSSTVVVPKTTVITITSCSEEKCSEVKTTTGYTVVTSEDTIYTTYCPLTVSHASSSVSILLSVTSISQRSSSSSLSSSSRGTPSTPSRVPTVVIPSVTTSSSTVVVPKTTVITLTSCSENKCSEVKTTTGYTVVTSEDTIYTTYCPLTVSHASSSVSILLSVTSISQRSSSSSLSSSSRGASSTPSSVPTVVIPSVTTSSSTVVVPKTTVITITSCSEEKCSEVKTTTGYTVVTSEDTIYTTYCPLTVSPSESPTSSPSFTYQSLELPTTKATTWSLEPSVVPSGDFVSTSAIESELSASSASSVINSTPAFIVLSCTKDLCSEATITTSTSTITSDSMRYTTLSGDSSTSAYVPSKLSIESGARDAEEGTKSIYPTSSVVIAPSPSLPGTVSITCELCIENTPYTSLSLSGLISSVCAESECQIANTMSSTSQTTPRSSGSVTASSKSMSFETYEAGGISLYAAHVLWSALAMLLI